MTAPDNSQNITNFIVKNAFKILFVAFIIFEMFHLLFPFLMTLIFAGVIALAVQPYIDKIEKKYKMSRGVAVALFMFCFAFVILVPTTMFVIKGSQVVIENFNNLLGPDFNWQEPAANQNSPLTKITAPVETIIQKVTDIFAVDPTLIKAKMNSFFATALTFTFGLFNKLLTQIPDFIFDAFLLILTLWYFLLSSFQIKRLFRKYSFMKQVNALGFINSLSNNARSIFVSNIVTGFMQSLIMATGAYFCGYKEFFLVWFITFIFSFIPLIGAAPVGILLAIFSFVQGDTGHGIGLLVVSGVTGLSDNIIRPILMSSGETKVNAFVAFIAVLGGIFIYGIPGLFLGPLVASICFDSLQYIYNDFVDEQELKEE